MGTKYVGMDVHTETISIAEIESAAGGNWNVEGPDHRAEPPTLIDFGSTASRLFCAVSPSHSTDRCSCSSAHEFVRFGSRRP